MKSLVSLVISITWNWKIPLSRSAEFLNVFVNILAGGCVANGRHQAEGEKLF